MAVAGSAASSRPRKKTPSPIDRLEDRYSDPANHGRRYTNLSDLESEGLIETEEIDGRTNAYRVTDRGRELLSRGRDSLDAALEVEGVAD